MRNKITKGGIVKTLPATLINADGCEVTVSTVAQAQVLGWAEFVPSSLPPPLPEDLQAAALAQIQDHLDRQAQSIGYDHIVSLCSYAGSTYPKFAAEAQAGIKLRDTAWLLAGEIWAAVSAGQRPMPTPAEIAELLPVLQLPGEG